MKFNTINLVYGLMAIALFFSANGFAQSEFPGRTWEKYANLHEAGFSKEKIALAKTAYDQTQAAALLVIHDGKVLVDWGDNTRKFMIHSIRKSFLNALIGIYEEKGDLQINQTLEELNIDDKIPLTNIEKQATLGDLLSARSGVYLPSAYSPRGMEKNLPERGSHAPGTFWYYNNWDFNVLGTIFEQETGKKVFTEFQNQIAIPLMMEDFEVADGHYLLEEEKSIHPAYLFRASARDMARFGLLYLNKGRWEKKQIVHEKWIKKSTTVATEDLGDFDSKGGFGYLWWISDGINGQPMYYASGSGGHRIMIFPESDMVIVQRVNTYERNNVSDEKTMEVVSLILDAKTGTTSPKPSLVEFQSEKKRTEVVQVSKKITDLYLGKYSHPFLGEMVIQQSESSIMLKVKVGDFEMFPLTENLFYPEDIETPIEFVKTEDNEKRMTVESIFNDKRSMEKVIFFY